MMARIYPNCKIERATYDTSKTGSPPFGDTGTACFSWSIPFENADVQIYEPPAWRTKRERVDAGLTRLEHSLTEFFRRGWKI